MFDLYNEQTMNFSGHKRITTIEGIETTIAGLGWSQKEGNTISNSLINGIVISERLLKCTHKGAESLKCWKYYSVVIASPDA